jgi:hypothetical protein
VALLATAMMIYGGHKLTSGLVMATSNPNEGVVASTAAATRDLQAIASSIDRAHRAHPVAVRVNTGSKLAMGLIMLLAVAAVFSADPRARQITLAAAWAGIAYQIGDAIFMFRVVRKAMLEIAPVLADLAARQAAGGSKPVPPGTMVDVGIVGTTLVSIGFSVLLLTYFGGRRGRSFFGVGADIARRQPHHGG